jgi:7-cyano-7-deazaguanine synthase
MMDSGEHRAVALVSGGLDSCVSLAWTVAQGWDTWLLHATYGQRTERREETAFKAIAEHFSVPEERRLQVPLSHLAAIGGSSLTDHSIPVETADLNRAEVPSTYVPFRNTHLLATAASWAEVIGADRIVIGAVYEDGSGYPDCTPEYYRAFNRLLSVAVARGPIVVETPVIRMHKSQIVRLGIDLKAPLHLTWSCYQNEDKACGVCDSCVLRLRGFEEAGAEDPIPYVVRNRIGRSGTIETGESQ